MMDMREISTEILTAKKVSELNNLCDRMDRAVDSNSLCLSDKEWDWVKVELTLQKRKIIEIN